MTITPQQNTPAAASPLPSPETKTNAATVKAAQAPKGIIAKAVVKMVNSTAFGTPAMR
jgi:hypothetical protein